MYYVHKERGVLFNCKYCILSFVGAIFFPLSLAEPTRTVKPFSVDIARDQDFRQCLLLYMLLLLLLLLLRTADI